MRRAVALLLLLAAGATSAAASGGEVLTPVAADRETLAAVVAESRVATTPEQPGVGAYLRDLSLAFFAWLATLLGLTAEKLRGAAGIFRWLGAPLVYGALLAVVALLLFRLLRSRRRRPPARTPAPSAPLTPAAARRELADWEEELRRRLDAGAPLAACEALWWWLARSLAGERVEAAWTSRELLAAARRPDLGAPVRRLDRFLYGLRPPSTGEVRGLWEELRARVAATADAEARG